MFPRIRLIVPVLTVLAAVFSVSCTRETVEDRLLLQEEVSASNAGQFIAVETAGSWRIELDFPGGTEPWCRVSPESGTGSKRNIQLVYGANDAAESRTVLVRAVFASSVVSRTLIQAGKTDPEDPEDPENPEDLVSDPVYAWTELPAVSPAAEQAYVAHYTGTGPDRRRNYSMLYDARQRVALWVAYPLCGDYLGSSGRTDAWGFDPKIPRDRQPVMFKGLGNGFDRGHQLPSADRTVSRSLNATTFYFTNMTPQRGELNQRAWADLEGRVRGYASTCDTLYVVTGAVLTTESDREVEYTPDNEGNPVAVPKAYFKVLLKYRAGSGPYSAIGFWMEHRGYGASVSVSETQTVREIEQRTGYDFFTHLPDDVAERLETEYNPSAWGF